MGLSRRIKYKFKFTRKYNTNVYNFFTKKKSTRKVFEEKYLINFLQVETESLKTRFSYLIQKLWFAKYRQRRLVIGRKKHLKSKFSNLRKKAKTLFFIFFYANKKKIQQQKIFSSTRVSFFSCLNFFCFYKLFLNFFLFLAAFSFKQAKVLTVLQEKNLEKNHFVFAKAKGLTKKTGRTVFGKNKRVSNVAANKFKFFNKTRSLFHKIQNVIFYKKRHFALVRKKSFGFVKNNLRTLFSPQVKILKNYFNSKVLFNKNRLANKDFFLQKHKKLEMALFFSIKNKKKQNKNIVNFDLYKREGFEIAWFFFDLLQNFYLYEKLQSKIFNEFNLLFIMAFPFFSQKMRKFLLKTFFKQKTLPIFKYNQRAPRVFEYFFTKLQKKYGFKAMDVPFRLDVPLPRYKIKKQTEKLEMYKLLKITRRNYGHVSRKIFWKIREKVYNKTKGYAFFNQLLFYESRLDIFLMRARLCDSLQEARGFIFKGWICVNGKQIFNLNYIVTLMDIVSVFSEKMIIFKHFFLNKCLQLLNEYSTTMGKIFPKYLESNFLHMAFCYVPKIFSVEKIPGQFALNKTAVTNWGKFTY